MRKKSLSFLFLLLLSATPVKALSATSHQNGVTATLPDCVKVSEKAVLRIDSTRHLPAGAFWRVDVTWSGKPLNSSPEVLAGVPETDIRFSVPGKYRCTVETGIVTKGSCAGVTYDKLSTHVFDIEVQE